MKTFYAPREALSAVLDASLNINIGEVLAKSDPDARTLVLQVRRLTDAAVLHVHFPIDNFKEASSFADVIERDPAATAKLILFLA